MPRAMLPSQCTTLIESGSRNTSRNRVPSTIETTSMIALALTANVMYIAPSTASHSIGSVGPAPAPPRIANATSASVMPIRNCETL